MRVLMLAHRFPYPPTRGDCIRLWGELQHLAQNNEVWFACVDRARPRPEHLAEVRRRCGGVAVFVTPPAIALARGVLAMSTGRSLSEGYFGDRRLRAVIRAWADTVSFDAILTVSTAMAPYAPGVPAPRRVLDMNDADSCKWAGYARRACLPLRWLYACEARRLAALERTALAAHDVGLVVNARERTKLLPLAGNTPVVISRTGVDLGYYHGRELTPHERCAGAPVVGMLGSMFYAPNVRAVEWFGRRVWPLLRQQRPDVQWLIVGNRPSRAVRRWGRQPGVTVTGFVPDVRPYLQAMHVYVNAVQEAIGVQTKLIEALAAGRAAVVTSAAADGLDTAAAGRPFLVADRPEEFAGSICRLLADAQLASRLSAGARRFAASRYRLEDEMAAVESLLCGGAPVRPHGSFHEPLPGRDSADACLYATGCELVSV